MPTDMTEPTNLNWQKMNGLIPAIVQDASSGRVLMLGYMNEDALEKTRSSSQVTFYSRSRETLWTKGETSGNTLGLVSLQADCDNDTLLVLAEPAGPTCHTGETSCFDNHRNKPAPLASQLHAMAELIARRDVDRPQGSYTTELLESGITRQAQKVGEEGVEVALAAATGADDLKNEAADLLYHLLVLLQSSNSSLDEVLETLKQRGG